MHRFNIAAYPREISIIMGPCGNIVIEGGKEKRWREADREREGRWRVTLRGKVQSVAQATYFRCHYTTHNVPFGGRPFQNSP